MDKKIQKVMTDDRPIDDEGTALDIKMGARHRKMTDKGLEYTIQRKQRHLDNLCRGLNKNMDYINNLMSVDTDIVEMKKHYAAWIALYDEFLQVDEEHRLLLTEDETRLYDSGWFKTRQDMFQIFKDHVHGWFLAQQRSDSVSVRSRKSRGSTSSTSSKRSILSARILEEQKRAELAIRAATLKKKRDLEKEKLRLKLEEEEINIEEEIAISVAKVKILDQMETGSSRKSIFDDHDLRSTHAIGAAAAMSVVQHLKKPTSELKRFSGSPLEFQRFMRQFKTKVIMNCDDSDEKLNYLEQYTTGEANRIVSGFSYLDAEKGYCAALQELQDRYGDPEVIVNAFIRKALAWPQIRADQPKAIDEFSIFLTECECAVQSMDALRILEYSENFKKIVGKLPFHLHDRWRSIVLNTKEHGNTVKFTQLVKFVRQEAKKANDPTFGRDAIASDQKDQHKRVQGHKSSGFQRSKGSFVTSTSEAKHEYREVTKPTTRYPSSGYVTDTRDCALKQPCMYCSGQQHSLDVCDRFSVLPSHEKVEYLKIKGLCFGCLKVGHVSRLCRHKATCQQCNKRHPTVLHINWSASMNDDRKTTGSDDRRASSGVKTISSSSIEKMNSHVGAGDADVTMAIIPVSVRMANGIKTINTYAFLDPGSNVSFCSEDIVKQLGCSGGKKMKIKLGTMGETQTMYTHVINGLEVGNLDGDDFVQLPKVYTKNKMPVSHEHIPTSSDISQWSHLEDISLPQIQSEVGLLIGNNIPDAYTPLELRTGPRGSPHAARTVLGWVVWSVIRETKSLNMEVNRAEVIGIQEAEELRQLSQLYQRSVDIDFPERGIDDKREPSQEDNMFMEKAQSSIITKSGHYEVGLPFRKFVLMPSNKEQAVQRLRCLQRKMNNNPTFHTDYTTFMEGIIEKGYATRVPDTELKRADGKVWYVPHHGVYHPKKPTKIRVVFDCAAVYKGISLNSVLLQGPNLTNNLFGVLLRFRQEPVAMMGDIEAMFHQVKVPPEDQDCLRFLWYPDGKLDGDPAVYRMTVHLFGAVSSPSICTLALHQTAKDHHEDYHEASDAIMNNFYVDDFLKSVASESKAISLVQDVRAVCQMGGFRLTKFVSNSRPVLETIPEEERAQGVRNITFDDKLPMERALGICWNVDSDSFGFKITVKSLKPTRKNLLSIVCSVYDPLGLASPFILPAKILLQDLCRRNIEWDTVLSGKDLLTWKTWLNNLPKLENLTVPRCLIPSDFGEVTCTQLHHFADASDLGYGIVSYVRTINGNDQVHCSLLHSKARVAPLKKTTTPRMELTAATIAVKLNRKLQQELDIHVDEVFYWTDSMAVLRYIFNKTTRFHTFVANRIAIIHEGSEVEQWRHVSSKSNPADCVSRGLSIENLLQAKWWVNGPAFLRRSGTEWPMNESISESLDLPYDDPEIKKKVNVALVDHVKDDVIDRLILRYSDWMKLKRVLGWVMLYTRKLRVSALKRKKLREELSETVHSCDVLEQAVNKEIDRQLLTSKRSLQDRINTTYLSEDILMDTEMFIYRYVQEKHFPEELKCLQQQNHDPIHKQSPLCRLDPFICDGVIRVGGRLDQSTLEYDARHPVIMPKDSPVSKLILEQTHKDVGHLGRNSMLSKLRQHHWIIGANASIRKLLLKCVTCTKHRAKCTEQKMADLPPDRVTPDEPAFTRVGVDYFGPFEVKRGRTVTKRYGVIFTCFSTRAVHLEIACSLDTDSCINAIRRFIARRGCVKIIYSDNGTNLVGAERELRREINKWNISKFHEVLQNQHVSWRFNPPAGSHFGGVWERLIRSIRKILYSLLQQQSYHLDDEGLHTVFCEVESILNSRPITSVSCDPYDIEALTPNHLLLLRPGQSLPCGIFDKSDNYSRRRWRQVQYLADVFWSRWRKEYLPLLQERQKWMKPRRNISPGDMVLVMDNSPRNSWTMGRVINTLRDRHGLVRIAYVKTPTNVLQRPVHKLCLLMEGDDCQ
jgi:hypothetical protein